MEISISMRFEVLTMMKMSSVLFWDVMPYSLMGGY